MFYHAEDGRLICRNMFVKIKSAVFSLKCLILCNYTFLVVFHNIFTMATYWDPDPSWEHLYRQILPFTLGSFN